MRSVITIAAGYYSENNIRYVFLDGSACGKIETCFIALQQQLSIPGYFGHNLDALEEVLDDLDWITEKKIKIIIVNRAVLLQHEPAKKKIFLDILQTAGNEKIEIIYLEPPAAPVL